MFPCKLGKPRKLMNYNNTEIRKIRKVVAD